MKNHMHTTIVEPRLYEELYTYNNYGTAVLYAISPSLPYQLPPPPLSSLQNFVQFYTLGFRLLKPISPLPLFLPQTFSASPVLYIKHFPKFKTKIKAIINNSQLIYFTVSQVISIPLIPRPLCSPTPFSTITITIPYSLTKHIFLCYRPRVPQGS